jgi:hypothetical protein
MSFSFSRALLERTSWNIRTKQVINKIPSTIPKDTQSRIVGMETSNTAITIKIIENGLINASNNE